MCSLLTRCAWTIKVEFQIPKTGQSHGLTLRTNQQASLCQWKAGVHSQVISRAQEKEGSPVWVGSRALGWRANGQNTEKEKLRPRSKTHKEDYSHVVLLAVKWGISNSDPTEIR